VASINAFFGVYDKPESYGELERKQEFQVVVAAHESLQKLYTLVLNKIFKENVEDGSLTIESVNLSTVEGLEGILGTKKSMVISTLGRKNTESVTSNIGAMAGSNRTLVRSKFRLSRKVRLYRALDLVEMLKENYVQHINDTNADRDHSIRNNITLLGDKLEGMLEGKYSRRKLKTVLKDLRDGIHRAKRESYEGKAPSVDPTKDDYRMTLINDLGKIYGKITDTLWFWKLDATNPYFLKKPSSYNSTTAIPESILEEYADADAADLRQKIAGRYASQLEAEDIASVINELESGSEDYSVHMHGAPASNEFVAMITTPDGMLKAVRYNIELRTKGDGQGHFYSVVQIGDEEISSMQPEQAAENFMEKYNLPVVRFNISRGTFTENTWIGNEAREEDMFLAEAVSIYGNKLMESIL